MTSSPQQECNIITTAHIKVETSTPHRKHYNKTFIQFKEVGITSTTQYAQNSTISHIFGGTSFSIAPHDHNNIREHNLQLSY